MNSFVEEYIRNMNDDALNNVISLRDQNIIKCQNIIVEALKYTINSNNIFKSESKSLLAKLETAGFDYNNCCDCILLLKDIANSLSMLKSQKIVNAYCAAIILYVQTISDVSYYSECKDVFKKGVEIATENARDNFDSFSPMLFFMTLEDARNDASFCLSEKGKAIEAVKKYHLIYSLLDKMNNKKEGIYNWQLHCLMLEIACFESLVENSTKDSADELIELFKLMDGEIYECE